jgi:nucleoside-diphosphate-sugar epimerase
MRGPALLTLGHGYSAAALAASLDGWRITGTTRSAERAAAMRAAGVTAVDWEDRAGVDRAIGAADAILVSLPPGEAGDPTLSRHGAALSRSPAGWVGYLSTTGVYGDRGGAWVDEAGALRPVNARSRRRVAAEAAWTATGLPVEVFRLAGIYGPGRNVLDKLRAGTARRVAKPGQVFSRIHVEVVGGALAAALARPRAGRVLNLADDLPAPPGDVNVFAAELLGMPAPPEIPFERAELTPLARSFWDESKRVSNRQLKAELGLALRWADYRAGLAGILAGGG